MTILRQEIVEAQKARTDLVKWKLLLVSVLGATGLGLTGSPNTPYVELILCCIPFVCTYVDLLLYHQALLINVIGEFMRSHLDLTDKQDKSLRDYETFSWKVRHMKIKEREISAFDLEKMVLAWSSMLISASILIFAVAKWKRASIPIGISGMLGIGFAIWAAREYEIRKKQIRDIEGGK